MTKEQQNKKGENCRGYYDIIKNHIRLREDIYNTLDSEKEELAIVNMSTCIHEVIHYCQFNGYSQMNFLNGAKSKKEVRLRCTTAITNFTRENMLIIDGYDNDPLEFEARIFSCDFMFRHCFDNKKFVSFALNNLLIRNDTIIPFFIHIIKDLNEKHSEIKEALLRLIKEDLVA